MSEESTITSKGQITIPARIRKKLNLETGKKVIFIETDDGVIVKPLVHNIRSLRGIFQTTATAEDLQEAVSKIHDKWRIKK